MKLSIQQTNLSGMTLNMIALTASVLASNGAGSIEKLEGLLIELAELAFTDGKLSSSPRKDYSFQEPETFPNDLKWDEALKQPRQEEVI